MKALHRDAAGRLTGVRFETIDEEMAAAAIGDLVDAGHNVSEAISEALEDYPDLDSVALEWLTKTA